MNNINPKLRNAIIFIGGVACLFTGHPIIGIALILFAFV